MPYLYLTFNVIEETDSASLNAQRLHDNAGQDLSNLLQSVNIRDSIRRRDLEGPDDQQDAAPVNPSGQIVPTKQDFLIACATHPGMIGYGFLPKRKKVSLMEYVGVFIKFTKE